MNFSQLKYIVSVDRLRNFARAAEDCGVAQSTLSREIQRLEKEFGIMIFDRSRFPVVPTLKGGDLVSQAKKILQEHDRFVDIARKMHNEPQGTFRLAILPDIAPYLLPLFIQQLAVRYPELKVIVTEMTEKDMVSEFGQNRLDAALAVAPFFRQGYYEDVLFDEAFVLYVSPKHPLYQQATISLADIPWQEVILPAGFRDYLLNLPDKTGISGVPDASAAAQIHYLSSSPETIRKIIDRNGGLTMLPELACLYMGERRLAMVRNIESPPFTRKIILVTPRGFEKNRIVKVIRKEIIKNLPKAAERRKS